MVRFVCFGHILMILYVLVTVLVEKTVFIMVFKLIIVSGVNYNILSFKFPITCVVLQKWDYIPLLIPKASLICIEL